MPNTQIAAENLVQYEAVYITSAGTMAKAKADSETTLPVVTLCKAATIALGASGLFYQNFNIITNSAWSWTPGLPIYTSAATAGALTQTAPSGAGQYKQRVGMALAATSMLWIPEIDYDSAVAGSADYDTLAGTAGESLTAFQLCYLKSDGKFWKADCDAVATMPGLVLAPGSLSANDPGDFYRRGKITNGSWSWATLGGLIYASATAGGLTQTAPSGSGQQLQIVGVALTATVIDFEPNAMLIEVA